MPHRPGNNDGENPDRVSGPNGEIYIEYKQVGQTMKVIAVDAATGIEAVIMGPASTAQSALQRVAVSKLQMLLEKEGDGGGSDISDKKDDPDKSDPKGWIA